MSELRFSAKVRIDYYDVLDRLFFFNKNQQRRSEIIEAVIAQYGEPKIINDDQMLRMTVGGYTDTQTLFASLGPRLVGALLYLHNSPSNMSILHLVVDEAYSLKGKYADYMLSIQMIAEVRRIAQRIDSIKTISIEYVRNHDEPLKLPVV